MTSAGPSSSAQPSRYSVDDDPTLKDVDRLLAGTDEEQGDYPRLASNSSVAGAPPAALVSLLVLYLSSTVSASAAPHVATQTLLVVLSLPVTHFSLLILLAWAHGALRPRSIFGNGASRITLGRGDGAEERWIRQLGWVTGAVSALAMLLGLWEARWLDGKLGQAIEVFLLPTLLLLSPLAASYLTSAARSPALSTNFTLSCLATSFLVALALFGVPARHSGLAVAALRLPVVAVKMLLLKEGLGESQVGQYLTASATSGFIVSCVALLFGLIRGSNDSLGAMPPHEYLYLLLYTFATVGTQIALLFALYHLAAPIYAALTLLPRNLSLILWATLGRGGLVLRSTWLQMVVILAGGSYATIATDEGLSSAVRDMASKVRRGKTGWATESSPSPRDSDPRPHLSRKAALLPFIPLFVYLLQSPSTTTSLAAACSFLPVNVRSTLCHTITAPVSRSVDLVIAYYDEDLDQAKHHVQAVRERKFVRSRESRVVVYNKGPKSEVEIRKGMSLRRSDEVIPLPNYGREGATYLQHILLHYNASIAALATALDPFSSLSLSQNTDEPSQEGLHRSRILADHTFFLQPHLAWEWVANPRIDLVDADTGFAHFGPMMVNHCGDDGRGTGNYGYVRDIYNIFHGEICPPEGTLSGWSAQMVVSKRRILANSYSRYKALDDLMEAPDDHWIHKLWGANDSGGQSNPALGHALERSWPPIFGCTAPTIADQCPDDLHIKEKCQCLDE